MSFTTGWLRPLGSSWSGMVSSSIVNSGVFEGEGGCGRGGGKGGGGGQGRWQLVIRESSLCLLKCFVTLVVGAACVVYYVL